MLMIHENTAHLGFKRFRRRARRSKSNGKNWAAHAGRVACVGPHPHHPKPSSTADTATQATCLGCELLADAILLAITSPSPLSSGHTLATLPPELQALIFSHLDKSNDLRAASLACSALRLEAQKELFREVVFDLDCPADRHWRKGDEDDYTARLQRKVTDTLDLPFKIRAIHLRATRCLSGDMDFFDGPAQDRLAILRSYLKKSRRHTKAVAFTLENLAWAVHIVAACIRSRHRPSRLEFRNCRPEALAGGILPTILERCPSYTHLSIGIRVQPEEEDVNYLERPEVAEFVAFFKRAQPQLTSLSFVGDWPWQYEYYSIVSSAFLTHARSLKITSSACSAFTAKLEELAGDHQEVLLEEVEIVADEVPDGDGNSRLTAQGDAVGMLALCPRLKRARITCELDDDDDF